MTYPVLKVPLNPNQPTNQPGSALGPTLGMECGQPLPSPFYLLT